VVGEVPTSADHLEVTLSLRGRGRAFFDEVELALAPLGQTRQEGAGWLPVPVGHAGFEPAASPDSASSWTSVWVSLTPDYPVDLSRENPYAGATSLVIDAPGSRSPRCG